jgi:hypothetical protein
MTRKAETFTMSVVLGKRRLIGRNMIQGRNSLAMVSCLALGSLIAAAQPYTISTVAGGGFLPSVGFAHTAALGFIFAIATDNHGDTYIGIQSAVLKMDPAGVLTQIPRKGWS